MPSSVTEVASFDYFNWLVPPLFLFFSFFLVGTRQMPAGRWPTAPAMAGGGDNRLWTWLVSPCILVARCRDEGKSLGLSFVSHFGADKYIAAHVSAATARHFFPCVFSKCTTHYAD
jgi:hypothetical protein